jgi:hypothetical protein
LKMSKQFLSKFLFALHTHKLLLSQRQKQISL